MAIKPRRHLETIPESTYCDITLSSEISLATPIQTHGIDLAQINRRRGVEDLERGEFA